MRLLTSEGRVVFAMATAVMFLAGVAVAYAYNASRPERAVVPDDFAVHPVACTPSARVPDMVVCVGEVPIYLEGRRIRLISEPMDGGAP